LGALVGSLVDLGVGAGEAGDQLPLAAHVLLTALTCELSLVRGELRALLELLQSREDGRVDRVELPAGVPARERGLEVVALEERRSLPRERLGDALFELFSPDRLHVLWEHARLCVLEIAELRPRDVRVVRDLVSDELVLALDRLESGANLLRFLLLRSLSAL